MVVYAVPPWVLCAMAIAVEGGALYGAQFVGGGADGDGNTTASLVRFDPTKSTWSKVMVFGTVPFSALAGLLATDTGTKWWLAAGESGQVGQNTLFYAASSTAKVVRLTTSVPLTSMEYVSAADEFLATWQEPGSNKHLLFGALDPYVAKENQMIDLTVNASIPWATFGSSCLDPASAAYTFIVGVESVAGGQFSLAQVAPNGHGIDVTLGKPCASGCTIQSVVASTNGIDGIIDSGDSAPPLLPIALTMLPQRHNATRGATYTYTWSEWDLKAGAPVRALGSWKSPLYNTFVTSAIGGGAIYAANAFGETSSVLRLELSTGTVASLPTAGLDGALMDLVYVE